MFWLKKAILAKIEGTYKTDPTPTGAANAVLARNISITPLDAGMADRNVVLPYYGNLGAIPQSASVKIDFEVEVAGAGAAGTAPAYGPLLRACGLSETINVGTNVIYTPVSAAFESVTMYFSLDGIQHKLLGCRGNMSLDFSNEAIPVYKFSFVGVYNAPTDVALPTLTLTAWKSPLAVNKVNTTPFTLHSYAGILSKLTADLGNSVQYKSYPNTAEEVRITDRKVKASLTMESVLIAGKDWWSLARAGTTGVLTLTHGTVAGNKVKLDMPAVQLGNPKYEDGSGVAMVSMDLMPQVVSGNDELTITVL